MRIGMVLARVDLNDGVASHLDTLTAELAAAGHELVLFSGPVSGQAEWQHRERSLASHVVAWERGPSFTSVTAPARWLREALRRHRPDVVHLHGLRPLPAVRLASRWRVPVVATAHPSTTSTRSPSRAKLAALRLARPVVRRFLPDRCIAISSELATWFTEVLGSGRQRVRLVCNGVDASRFSAVDAPERAAARQALGIDADSMACAMIARYVPGKRHDTALAALAALRSEGRNVSLVLAGLGDPDADVADLRRKVDPDGTVPVACNADVTNVRRAYAASDVLLLPSEREGFPQVVVEGMLCGLVPLRTPAGGASDQIEHGVSGFVFPVGDAGALAGHLRTLLDRPADRQAMARAAAARARERFTAKVMAEKTTNVYREVVHRAAADARTIV